MLDETTLKLIAENDKAEQDIAETIKLINANIEESAKNLAAIDFILFGGIR